MLSVVAMIEDIKRLGHDTATVMADHEPAIRSLQEKIQRRRGKPTPVDTSSVGQPQMSGVAERAVQAVSEQHQPCKRNAHKTDP